MTTAEPVRIGHSGATCPLCHTVDETVTRDSLRDGASWKCTRCGQTWDNERLEKVAGYIPYEAAHPVFDIHKSR